MEDLCSACLCSGRSLYYLDACAEMHQIYLQILNEITIHNTDKILNDYLRICWECEANLRRFLKFKRRAQSCYTVLLNQINQSLSIKDITNKAPQLKVEHVFNVSYPIDDLKPNAQDVHIKEEDNDTDEPFKKDDGGEPMDRNYDTEPMDRDYDNGPLDRDFNNEPVCDARTIEDTSYEVDKKCSKGKKNKKKKLKHRTSPRKKKKSIEETELSEVEQDWQNDSEDVPVTNGDIPPPTRDKEKLPEKPQCAECGKVFSSRKTYRYHLNVLHRGQNTHPCPRCGKVYQWKSNLGRHMRSHKAVDNNELYCRLCDKTFASIATYRQHLRISKSHVDETDFRYMCNECGKKFVNKTRLRDHIDWVHLKKIKYRCQLCDKAFKCHTSLYVHTQNVHKAKDKKDNLCHVCGKSYQNAAKLKYHIVAMHTSETPYQCDQCRAAFGWYSSLYRHVREVHYKMRLQPKKAKKSKKLLPEASLIPPGPV